MGITIEDLQVDDLHANPHNPRKQVGDVEELASSIRSQGIKQPLLVTPNGETDIDGHKQYRVVIGHRRLAAARQAGLSTVPAIVEEMDARREREIMLVENTQRSDLTPVEEADGYQGLLDLGVRVKENLDQIRMVLRDRPLRILDVLAARQEDNADWRAWRTMRGVDEMCVWYGALEHLGYQPSAEEREALKGAMVEKEQES